MKKLYITMVIILTCGATYALPIANPSEASLLCDGLLLEGHCGDPCDPCLTLYDAFSVRSGFWGDYVFNRYLEINHKNNRSDIEHTKLHTNAGFLAANFWDRLDLFTTLGATHLKINANAASFEVPGASRLELETDTHFSWSLGAHGTIWECGCTTLGAEAQYFRTRPTVRRITLDGAHSTYPNFDAKYHEWQVGLGVAHRINMFVPYMAVKWSRARLNFDNAAATINGTNVTLFRAHSSKHWGYALGVSLIDCEKASVTVEGRFGDEKALHVNGQIRF